MSGKQTAIITGAAGDIGTGLVERFLEEGYNVMNVSRRQSKADYLRQPGSPRWRHRKSRTVAANAVEAAINSFGTIDVLVNNAGIFLTRPFTDFTAEDMNALFLVNLMGFLYSLSSP